MLTRAAKDYQHHSRRKNKSNNNDPISMLDYYSTSNTDCEQHQKYPSFENKTIVRPDPARVSNKNNNDRAQPEYRQGWHWRELLHSDKHFPSDYDSEQSINAARAFDRAAELERYDYMMKHTDKDISSASPPTNNSSGYVEGTIGSRFGKNNKTHPIFEDPTFFKQVNPISLNRSNVGHPDRRGNLITNRSLNFDKNLIYNDEEVRGLDQNLSTKNDNSTNNKINKRVNIMGNSFLGCTSPGARLSNQRMNRHRRNQYNSRQDLSYYTVDPYALSELFSQSEIPGFREIFSSDSYLRKFCWIVAFVIFTILSLRDGCELWAEYERHPITVDLRHIDSSRLPFPAVTVCNLNIVKYSALCTSDAKLNLTNQIRSELRIKLCGIQVNETNDTRESDTGDINNFGITSTTSSPNSTISSSSDSDIASSTTHGAIDHDSIPTSTTVSSNDLDSFNDGEPSSDNNENSNSSTGTRAEHRSKQAYAKQKMDRLINRRSIRPSDETTAEYHPFGDVARRLNRPVGNSQEQYSGNVQHSTVHQEKKVTSIDGSRGFNPLISQTATKPKQAVSMTNTLASIGGIGGDSSAAQAPSSPNRNGITINNHASSNSYQSNQIQPITTTTTTTTTTFPPPALPEEFEISERQERELQENMTNWLAVMYNRDPKLTESLGHQFGDMILRCTMKSTNCTHPLNFHNHFTPTEGNCFTYKSRTRRRGQMKSEYEEANLAGTNHGLELVLNLEKNEYISGSSQVGALIMVHHPGDLGYAASEAIFVAPEHTTYIGLKMINITRLGSPHPEHCVDEWPGKFAANLTRNSTYSQQACIKICLQHTIQQRCSCQSALLPPLESDANSRTIICDTRKRSTKQCVEEVMFRSADKVNNCDCRPKCKVIRYDKTVSLAKWPTLENKVTFDRGKADLNFQHLAKIIVYFQTMTCEEVVQVRAFDASKLLSSLGGIMGIYVGFSFLSLFEIFEVMSRKLWHHFTLKYAARANIR